MLLFTTLMLLALGASIKANETVKAHMIRSNPGIAYSKAKSIFFEADEWKFVGSLPLDKLHQLQPKAQALLSTWENMAQICKTKIGENNTIRNTVISEYRKLQFAASKLNASLSEHSSKIEATFFQKPHFKEYQYSLLENQAVKLIKIREDNYDNSVNEDNTYYFKWELNNELESIEKQRRELTKLISGTEAILIENYATLESVNAICNKTTYHLISILQISKKIAEDIKQIIKNEKSIYSVTLDSILTNLITSAPSNIAISDTLSKPTRWWYFKNELIVEISKVTFKNEEFRTYKLISFPSFQKFNETRDAAVYIQPRDEYITFSQENYDYFFLNQKQISQCKNNYASLVCNFEIIRYQVKDCEALLFKFENSRDLHTCNVKYDTELKPFITQTTNPKVWLYSVHTPTDVLTSCADKNSFVTLKNSGILELPAECTLWLDGQVYKGFDGTYRPEDIIIPNVPLEVFNIKRIIESINIVSTTDSDIINKNLTENCLIPLQQLSKKNVYLSIGLGTALFIAILSLSIALLLIYFDKKHNKISPAQNDTSTYISLMCPDISLKSEPRKIPICKSLKAQDIHSID